MHRERRCCESTGLRGSLKRLELRRFPDYRREAVCNGRSGFLTPHASHRENVSLWSDSANGSTFFNAGHTQPCTWILRNQNLRAGRSVVPISVGLDDNEHLRLSSKVAEQAVVFKKPRAGNLRPNRS